MLSTITIINCDRCGKEIPVKQYSVRVEGRLKIRLFFCNGHLLRRQYDYDLCDDCYSKLMDFLQEEK